MGARPGGRGYSRGADIARTILGVIWIAGAGFNAAWTMRHIDLYEGFADDAPLGMVRWFFGDVVMVHGAFWTALLVLGELALGILTLGKGMWARIGIAASVAWSAFLFILLPPYTLMMGPFALAIAWLLRRDYPHSALHLLRRDQARDRMRRQTGSDAVAP